MEIYARSSDTADREAARLLQERFAGAFEADPTSSTGRAVGP